MGNFNKSSIGLTEISLSSYISFQVDLLRRWPNSSFECSKTIVPRIEQLLMLLVISLTMKSITYKLMKTAEQ